MKFRDLLETEQAHLDLAQIKVQYDDYLKRYRFTVPVDDVPVEVIAGVRDDALILIDIMAHVGRGHASAFRTSNPGEYGLRIGTRQTQQLLRYVIDYIKERHPNVKHVIGARRTGAGRGRPIDMPIPSVS